MKWDRIREIFRILKEKSEEIRGEIPVVCMLISEDKKIFITHNEDNLHAETVMINTQNVKNGIIFLNLEPCPMCLFNLHLSKVRKIYFDNFNPIYGACGGKFHLSQSINLNLSCCGGFKFYPCEVREFFQKKRIKVIKNQ